MVVTAPAACGFEGPAAGDDSPGGHELVMDLAVHALPGIGQHPRVQPVSAVAQAVVRAFVGSGDESVE